MRCSKRRRAFTLIEILVVVAIIALLISILLPSLARAKEQARVAVCLANLKSLGIAASAYIYSEQDRFCWGPPRAPSSSYYGGKRGDATGEGPHLAAYLPGGTLNFPAKVRPLNRYMYSGRVGDMSEMRAYECPSDFGVRNRFYPLDEPSIKSAYEVTGTSYQANVIWENYIRAVEGLAFGSAAWEARRDVLEKIIIRHFRKKGASRAILLQEDPCDVATGGIFWGWPWDTKMLGWHNRFDRHSILFLDGHAANIFVNAKMNLDHDIYSSSFRECSSNELESNPERCTHGTGDWISHADYGAQ